MSRAAFEKWQQKRFPLNEDDLNSDFIENALHEAWLAGRESMRDEAAETCQIMADGWDDAAEEFGMRLSEKAIRKIDL